jgi:hypothetical protein
MPLAMVSPLGYSHSRAIPNFTQAFSFPMAECREILVRDVHTPRSLSSRRGHLPALSRENIPVGIYLALAIAPLE